MVTITGWGVHLRDSPNPRRGGEVGTEHEKDEDSIVEALNYGAYTAGS